MPASDFALLSLDIVADGVSLENGGEIEVPAGQSLDIAATVEVTNYHVGYALIPIWDTCLTMYNLSTGRKYNHRDSHIALYGAEHTVTVVHRVTIPEVAEPQRYRIRVWATQDTGRTIDDSMY